MSAKILSICYGGRDVTDSATQGRVKWCIEEYKPLEITNENLGDDPQPGVRKSFMIDYEHNGFKKRRMAMEYETMDFSWDIIHIRYGTETRFNGDDFFKPGNHFFRDNVEVVGRLFLSLDSGNSFVVNNDMFGGDPALGDEKRCEVKYVHVENGGRDYAKSNENFGYWFVSMPEGEETDFGGRKSIGTNILNAFKYSKPSDYNPIEWVKDFF